MTLAGALLVCGLTVAAQSPDSFEQLSRQAAAARDANRTDEAIRLYRAALEARPEWNEGLWYLGTLFYERADYEEARDTLRRFVAGDADAGPGWVVLGLSEFQTHEYARALPHLERGAAAGLGDRSDMKWSARYFSAILLTRFERFDESMQLLVSAPSAVPRDTRFLEALGTAALRMPLLPGEVPTDRREMVQLAGEAASALAAHDDAGTEAVLKRLAAAYPNEPGVHFLHGMILMKSAPEAGIAEMRRELAITPDHVPARIQLAAEYTREGRPDDALPPAREAVELEPEAFDSHLALGQALVAKGDLTGGIGQLEKARDLAPRISQIRWALCRAYFAAGRQADGQRESAEMERLRDEERKAAANR